MKFSADELEEFLYGGPDTLEDEIVDTRRWYVTHRMVFRKDGKFYATFYNVGATEQQEIDRWEDDPVECEEVFPVEKVVIVYESASK